MSLCTVTKTVFILLVIGQILACFYAVRRVGLERFLPTGFCEDSKPCAQPLDQHSQQQQQQQQRLEVHDKSAKNQSCPIAIFVCVLPHRIDHRMAVRLTWGKDALDLNMQVYFVIGLQSDPLHQTAAQLEYENATYHDLLLSPHLDGYKQLLFKTKTSFYAAPKTNCRYYANVDGNTYFRPAQALDHLNRLEELHPNKELYVGHIWNNSKAIQDPNHEWYFPYERELYPPFASGYCYLLSMSLAARVAICHAGKTVLGPEDALTGICVDAVKKSPQQLAIVNSPFLNFRTPCDELRTITDNAVMTATNFNLYQRHEANLQAHFCSFGKRKFYAVGRAYGLSVDAYDIGPVRNTKNTAYLQLAQAPWTIPPSASTATTDRFHMAFLSTSEELWNSQWKASKKLLNTLGRTSQSGLVEVFACLNCVGSWFLTIHFPDKGYQTMSRQVAALNADGETGLSGPLLPMEKKLDIHMLQQQQQGLLVSCEHVQSLVTVMKPLENWDIHWIVGDYCSPEHQKINVIRNDAIVLRVSETLKFTLESVLRATSLVERNASAVFPIPRHLNRTNLSTMDDLPLVVAYGSDLERLSELHQVRYMEIELEKV